VQTSTKPLRKQDIEQVVPISNLPELSEDDVPDKATLKQYRLERRITELEDQLKTKDRKIETALEAIASQISFFRTGLHEHRWETMGEIQHRVVKLEAQLRNLLDHTTAIDPERKKIKTRWGER